MGKRYIAYEIQNKQPLLITNLDTSKPGKSRHCNTFQVLHCGGWSFQI